MMIAEVTVAPKSGKFSISVKGDRIKISLKSTPEQNKANLELVKELSRALDSTVKIISGHKSKHKRLEISISEDEWKRFLAQYH